MKSFEVSFICLRIVSKQKENVVKMTMVIKADGAIKSKHFLWRWQTAKLER